MSEASGYETDTLYFKRVYAKALGHPDIVVNPRIVGRTETVDIRTSESNPANGIVTWRTEGFNENGERVVGFRRSNLVRRRTATEGV